MKYTILTNQYKPWKNGKSVYRIQALRDFGNVKAGTIGGFVSCSDNLSQEGNCWIADNAVAAEFSCVQRDAVLSGEACLSGFAWIGGQSRVTGNAVMTDYTSAYDNAFIGGFAYLCEGASVFENGHVETKFQRNFRTMRGLTTVRGNARLLDHAAMYDKSTLEGVAVLQNSAALRENAKLDGHAVAEKWCCISGDAWVTQHARISTLSQVTGNAVVAGHTVVDGKSYITCRVRLLGKHHYKNVVLGGDLILC